MTVKDMTGKQWIEAFIGSLSEPTNLDRANDKGCYNSDLLWTEFMVKRVMKDTMAKELDCRVTCRDQNDKKNSGEYLNIDAMFFNERDYTLEYEKSGTDYDPRVLPAAVIEHENEGSGEDKIAHCLWKLLCIRSKLRVLICYHKDIDGIREFLENTIRNGKLAEGLTGELLVVIGDSSRNDDPWEKRDDIENYFKVFEWKNNRIEKFSD
jgi:hypothetical protein